METQQCHAKGPNTRFTSNISIHLSLMSLRLVGSAHPHACDGRRVLQLLLQTRTISKGYAWSSKTGCTQTGHVSLQIHNYKCSRDKTYDSSAWPPMRCVDKYQRIAAGLRTKSSSPEAMSALARLFRESPAPARPSKTVHGHQLSDSPTSSYAAVTYRLTAL